MPAKVPTPIRPLFLTADSALLDDLLRLAAAADVDVEVADSAATARASWSCAPLVLVGADLAKDLARREPVRRAGVVVVVGEERDEPDVWAQAVAVGAEQVAVLPEAETWLVDRLADALEGGPEKGVTVCVIGGRGGAGASVLATALAQTGARSGHRTLLVDSDPLGGGIDLVLGQEHAVGSRWSDFTGTRGRLTCAALRAALPKVNELAMLSLDREEGWNIPAEAMRAVLSAAERGCDLVVVDTPRSLDDAAVEALARSAVALLVVPAEVRATVAAAKVAGSVRRHTADVRVVVRGPAPTGLDGRAVAESIGLPLAGQLRAETDLAAALDRGDPPLTDSGGPLAGFCAGFLSQLRADAESFR